MSVFHLISQALVWDDALTGPFGLIAEYSLLKVSLKIVFNMLNICHKSEVKCYAVFRLDNCVSAIC